MSYPEPIPILRGKAAERMVYLLEHPIPLTDEQREFYRGALSKRDDDAHTRGTPRLKETVVMR